MRGTSAVSLRDVVREASDALRADDVSRERVADELFRAADVIDSSSRLVRLLSDAGQEPAVKESAAQRLFAEHVTAPTLGIIRSIVTRAWSEQEDILDALEQVGAIALFEQADSEGALQEVEEQLFQLSRLVDGNPELVQTLDGAREDSALRTRLVGSLLEGRAHRITTQLAVRAVERTTEEKPSRRIFEFAEFAAEQRRRLLAVVSTARPLTEQQQQRLASILAGIYGREVQMNFEVAEDVVGGLRINVGDDLYDATVLSRLGRARARLAS